MSLPDDPDTQRARWESRVDADLIELRTDIGETKHDIREMRDDLLKNPSWAVTALLTTLTTAVGILATMVAITAG